MKPSVFGSCFFVLLQIYLCLKGKYYTIPCLCIFFVNQNYPFFIQVDGKKAKPRPTAVRVLLPHEVLDAIAHSSPSVLHSGMLGDLSSDARTAFWGHVSRLEPWRDHPTIKNNQWDQLVGISIHGDGCEIYREDEFFVWSWSSIFVSPSLTDVLIRRYPIAVIPERQMRKSSVLHLYFIKFCFVLLRFRICSKT